MSAILVSGGLFALGFLAGSAYMHVRHLRTFGY